jgi:carboxylate-amine ligase
MIYQRSLLNENKWRASRYGIEGSLIDFGKEAEVETKSLIYELMDFVDDVVDHLGSREVISQNIEKIFQHGTGADRQLKVFKETNSLVKVVDYIHDQFLIL